MHRRSLPSPSFGAVRDRRYRLLNLHLEEKFEAAVVISRQGGHDSFLANFAPVILIEKISDTGEDSSPAFPKSKFGRQVPNVVSWDEAFERIAIITKFIIYDRAKEREFEGILVAIDPASLDLVIRCICRRVAAIWPGRKLGVQQRNIAVERQIAVRTGNAAVDQRQDV
jgi:hypothetical protein